MRVLRERHEQELARLRDELQQKKAHEEKALVRLFRDRLDDKRRKKAREIIQQGGGGISEKEAEQKAQRELEDEEARQQRELQDRLKMEEEAAIQKVQREQGAPFAHARCLHSCSNSDSRPSL
jgi:hypothetical protein